MPNRSSASVSVALATGFGLLCLCSEPALAGFDLKPATLKAFERYVQLTEARMDAEIRDTSPFLWIDRVPEAARRGHLEDLKSGGVVVSRLETRDGKTEVQINDGWIHHWIGTVLLPAKLDRVRAFVQDYARYPEHFGPMIQRSRVITQTASHYDVAMRTWARKAKVTVVLDADYGIDYRPIGPTRLVTKSVASNIFKVESPGESNETRHPVEKGTGWLWRLNTYCSFEERKEGTYEQCESISLTQDAPWGLGWLIRPFVTEIPLETLKFTLGRVRSGLGGSITK